VGYLDGEVEMSNHLGQILLLIGLLFFIFYVIKIRKLVFDRIIFIIGAIVGIFLVFFPEVSTVIANWMGIGRGADLVFYLFIIVSLFYFVSVNAEIRNLQKQITELTRTQALANPMLGKQNAKRKAAS
jgi:hypothetical protein